MAIRIPSNITVKSQYTAGKQYMYESTQREYQGYYYEMNGKIFAGKEFNSNAPTLLKITPDNINSLLTSAATYVYGKITGTKINPNKPFPSYFIPSEKDVQKGYAYRYFSQQKNNSLIKEINEDNFKILSTNALYTLVKIKCYVVADSLDSVGNNNYVFDSKELDQAEKQIQGIKTFLLG
jgi:hypothetical protein